MTEPERNLDEHVARFTTRARERIQQATFEDAMAFLKVGEIAQGSQHARFQQVFPKNDDGTGGGLQTLVEMLKQEAANAPDVSTQLDNDLIRLQKLIKLVKEGQAQPNRVGDEVRNIAAREFNERYDSGGQDLDAQIRALMVAVAKSDRTAAKLLTARFHRTDALYADRYEVLLAALGRQPITELANYTDFALTIASVMSGFLTRATIEDDESRVLELFRAIIVPLISTITYPIGSPPPTDESLLFGDTIASTTEAYLRTGIDVAYVALDDLHDLVGTWKGVRYERGDRAGREVYLVVDTSDAKLKVTTYTSSGLSRMITPTFVHMPTRRRLSCMFEAERTSNPRPDYPSHRGAWVLEAHNPVTELQATYFNDRGWRGRCVFGPRSPEVVGGFFAAQALFPSEETSSPSDTSSTTPT